MQEISRCGLFGLPTGREVPCGPCGRNFRLKTFACSIFGECTPIVDSGVVKCCATCPHSDCEILPGHRDPCGTRPVGKPKSKDQYEPATMQRYREAFHGICHDSISWPPPVGLKGDGIIFVSDEKFYLMTAIAIRMTRDVCPLPIQWWYNGIAPPRERWIDGVADVTLHDLNLLKPLPRIRSGWPMKLVAILNSGLARVLYLDSDAYLVAPPDMAFEVLPQKRFVYWRDLDSCERNVNWSVVGADPARGKHVPQVQGGQYCVDVAACWRELAIAYWMDQHSDFYYTHVYADQDLIRIAFGVTQGTYHVPGRARWWFPAFLCGFPHLEPFIVHRCQGKIFTMTPRRHAAFNLPRENEMWQYKELLAH